MSADTYHVVRKHPLGGYTYVCAFASEDDPDITVDDRSPQYETFTQALVAATEDYSEYGVRIHQECHEEAHTADTV